MTKPGSVPGPEADFRLDRGELTFVVIDECTEFTEETWKVLEAMLPSSPGAPKPEPPQE